MELRCCCSWLAVLAKVARTPFLCCRNQLFAMILKPQTYLYLVTAILLVASMFLPLWEEVKMRQGTLKQTELTALSMELTQQQTGEASGESMPKVKKSKNTVLILAFLVAGAGVSLAAIPFFDSRKKLQRQMQFSIISTFLIGAGIGAMVYYSMSVGEGWITASKGNYGYGFFTAVASMVSNMVGRRFSHRDIRWLKQQDRMVR